MRTDRHDSTGPLIGDPCRRAARSVTQSVTAISGAAMSTNSTPATTYGVKLNVCAVAICAARTASTRPASDTSPTSFCSATMSLSSGGATRRTACGSTTCRIVCR